MKKKRSLLVLFLVLILVLLLSACGKSDVARSVDDQIAAIGQIHIESEAQIIAAEEAVAALAEEDRKQLDNVKKLEQARADYEKLVLEREAEQVDNSISAIGEVTLESKSAVAAARSLYDSSKPEVQALVKSMSVLETAEETLRGLLVEQATNLISAIGDVTLEKTAQIQAAQKCFDDLSAEDAAKVGNADALLVASDQLKTLRQAQGEVLLKSMRKEEDRVQGMSFYYPSTLKFYSDGSWAADVRSFILPYLGQKGDEVWLRLLCNYTGDDWIFFEKIIFSVDGKNYSKSFRYYDIVHDNDGGEVWEYIDTDVSNSDIEILRAITNSTETIIRFQGDDYAHDITVNASDKQAIRDMLTVYDSLK